MTRIASTSIAIEACSGGQVQTIIVSDYNAWRIFGMLSVMLGLPLPPHVAKAIKL